MKRVLNNLLLATAQYDPVIYTKTDEGAPDMKSGETAVGYHGKLFLIYSQDKSVHVSLNGDMNMSFKCPTRSILNFLAELDIPTTEIPQ